jgi:hypothetical protein
MGIEASYRRSKAAEWDQFRLQESSLPLLVTWHPSAWPHDGIRSPLELLSQHEL